MVNVVGVRFKKACKVYDFESSGLELSPGDAVIVEVDRGLGLGTVVYMPREIDQATLTRPLKKVVRKADIVDVERQGFNTERENEAFRVCREKIIQYNLPMKLIRVEYLFDSSKAIFYFTSDTRVDFRELVKDLAATFHTRIEMRQIGVRDESKMIGGLGPCGRELCCSSFLADFEPVTIKMAKEQNLALNPVKISGICGRLMCCLSYEHEMYQVEKAEKGRAEKESAEKAEGEEKGQQRRELPDKGEKGGRGERPGKGERAARGDRPEKRDRQNRGERPDKDKGERQNRGERPDKGERPDRSNRPDRGERPDRGNRPEKGGDRQDRGERAASNPQHQHNGGGCGGCGRHSHHDGRHDHGHNGQNNPETGGAKDGGTPGAGGEQV